MATLGPNYRSFHRSGDRVRWMNEINMWFVGGYDEVRRAARDDAAFSSRHDLPTGSSPYRGVMIPALPIQGIPLEMDDRCGAAFRHLLLPYFSADATAARAPRVEELTRWAIDRRIASGEMDVFDDLVKLIPAYLIMEILGLPSGAAVPIADAVHVRGDQRFGSHPGWDILHAAVADAITHWRRAPGPNVISALLTAEQEDVSAYSRPSVEQTIDDVCYTLVIGGMSTTAKLVLGALAHLDAVPEDRHLLLNDRSARPLALEEFLRFVSPVPIMARTATASVELGGCPIAPGDRVLIGFGAANHDPRIFDDPHELHVDRQPNRHVAMGLGAHACLGGFLGRLEASVMLGAVLDRLPDYRLADPPKRMGKLTVRPKSMPITFSPGPALGPVSEVPPPPTP